VDDPKGIYCKIYNIFNHYLVKNAKQILSIPVFCSTDKYEVGSDSLANLPRGVLQLINKFDPNGFDAKDIEKLEFLCNIVGRCHDSVLKIE